MKIWLAKFTKIYKNFEKSRKNGQPLAGQRLAHYCTRENLQSLKRSGYPFYRQYHLAAAYDPELIDNFEVRDQRYVLEGILEFGLSV